MTVKEDPGTKPDNGKWRVSSVLVAPLLFFCLGILLTGILIKDNLHHATKAKQESLDAVSGKIILSIAAEIDRYELLAYVTDAHLKSTSQYSRDAFRQFYGNIKNADILPKNIAISFNPLITRQNRLEHESEIRDSGFPDYRIRPIGLRDLYTPVLYIEPLSENIRALGFDTYSEPIRRYAMEQASLINKPVITNSLVLVQSTIAHPIAAVIMYYPHYLAHADSAVPKSRDSLMGWIAITIPLETLFNLVDMEHEQLYTVIYDGDIEAGAKRVFSNLPDRETLEVSPVSRKVATVGGRNWTFEFYTHAQSLLSRSETYNIVLYNGGLGVIFSLLISLFIFQTLRSRSTAFILNHKITKELIASENQFKTMYEQAPIGIAKVNSITGTVEYANRVYCQLVGVPEHKIKGANWRAFTHPDDVLRDLPQIERLANHEIKEFKTEKRYIHQDNKIIWVKLVAAAIEGDYPYQLSMIDDITQFKTEQKNLAEANMLKDLALRSAKAIHFKWVIDSNRLELDENSAQGMGIDLTKDFGKDHNFLSYIHEADRSAVIKSFSHQVAFGDRVDLSFRVLTREGSVRHMMLRGETGVNEKGNASIVNGLLLDVTQERTTENQLKAREEQLRLSTELANVATWEWDLIDNTLVRSENHDSLYGLSWQDSWTVDTFLGLTHPDDRELVTKRVEKCLSVNGPDKYQFDVRINFPDGTQRWLSILGVIARRNAEGKGTMVRGCTIDITQRKQAEELNRSLALFDQLTGLPNRLMMKKQFDSAINACKRHGRNLCLMFLDLDHFKDINNSLGHSVGDLLLIEISKIFKSTIRQEDTVARLGGDEFMIILPDTGARGAAMVAQNILSRLNVVLDIDTHLISTSVSIGISQFPEDGDEFERLAKNADIALYRAKNGGRSNFRFFTKEMQDQTARHLLLANALRSAIEKNELSLHYQAQFSDGIIGAEALLRWNHPILGSISPAEFIPIAEVNGSIVSIGEWVILTAAQQLKRWRKAGFDLPKVSVNFSATQFQQRNVVERVINIIESVGISRASIELELTEAISVNDPKRAISILEGFSNSGIEIAIDDFGTGFSSLSYLKKFKVNTIKIDQSFVKEITENIGDQAIVKATINMATSLGMKVIAEGVETKEQMQFLKDNGCHQYQGYYFSKPLPADECETLFKAHGLLKVASDNA